MGYDESEIPKDYMQTFASHRVSQLGLYDEDNLKMIPLGPCAQNFQDMRPFGHPNNPGLGIGSASHAIGTSKALEMGEIQGAMSSLAIVVTAILNVVVVPIVATFV